MTLYEPPPDEPRAGQGAEGSLSIPQMLLHLLLAGLVVAVLAYAALVLLGGAAPASATETVLRLTLLAMGLALLWSVGTQLGNAALSAVGGLGVLAVVAFALLSPLLLHPRLSASERAAPLVLDDGRLCQPALDVVLPRPGPAFRLEAEPPAQLRRLTGGDVHAWFYDNPSSGDRVVLVVSKAGGESEASFRSFVRRLEQGLEGGEEVQRRLRWQGGSGVFLHDWTAADGDAHGLVCRASGRRPGGEDALIACVLTVAASQHALAPLRDGLAFETCGGGS